MEDFPKTTEPAGDPYEGKVPSDEYLMRRERELEDDPFYLAAIAEAEKRSIERRQQSQEGEANE